VLDRLMAARDVVRVEPLGDRLHALAPARQQQPTDIVPQAAPPPSWPTTAPNSWTYSSKRRSSAADVSNVDFMPNNWALSFGQAIPP
jgi:hypothetical protein